MEQDQKHYYAFISYKREDEKWAKWLQKKLEHYRFPSNLNGRTDLPKNIRPTFRDVTDLEPGVLSEKIDTALRDSQWLIVVCSPRSAKSPWVCKEAQTFIDLGRTDRIIPFIIEGIPQSNDPVTECYPEAISNLPKEQELLGANINEMGRDAAAIKVVARMFGLKFDTLWQRHEREKRRKVIIFTTIILLIFALLSYFLFREIRYSKELNQKNELIERQNKNLIQSRDSTRIALRNVQEKNDTLTLTRLNLENSNAQLTKSNWHAMEVQARAVSIKALELIAEGDIYRGLALVMKILPTNTKNPERPFVPEMERAIRAANDSILYGHKIKCIMKSHNGCVYDAAIMKNDSIAATSSNDNYIRFWNLKTGEEIIKLRAEDFPFNTGFISFSNDGRYFIRRYSKENPVLSIWRVTTSGLKFIKQLQVGVNPVFSNDGRSLFFRGYRNSGTWKQIDEEHDKIYVYDTKTWECRGRVDNLKDSIYPNYDGLGICHHGEIIMCKDFYENLLSFRRYNDSIYIGQGIFFPAVIRCAKELSCSGDIFVTTDDGRSYLVRDPFLSPKIPFLFIQNVQDPFVLSENKKYRATNTGKVFSVEADGSDTIWSVVNNSYPFTGKEWTIDNDGKQYAYIKKGKGKKHEIVIKNRFAHDSIILSNPYSNEDIKDQVLSIAFSDDKKMIIGGFRNHKVAVWNIASGNVICSLEGHRNGVTSVSFFGDDRYALTSSYDQTIRFWDLLSKQEIESQRIYLNEKILYSTISQNMRYVAIATEDAILIYDRSNISLVCKIESSDCMAVWFNDMESVGFLTKQETDSSTIYGEYIYKMPSIAKLCERYSTLRSFYFSDDERKKYYLE